MAIVWDLTVSSAITGPEGRNFWESAMYFLLCQGLFSSDLINSAPYLDMVVLQVQTKMQ